MVVTVERSALVTVIVLPSRVPLLLVVVTVSVIQPESVIPLSELSTVASVVVVSNTGLAAVPAPLLSSCVTIVSPPDASVVVVTLSEIRAPFADVRVCVTTDTPAEGSVVVVVVVRLNTPLPAESTCVVVCSPFALVVATAWSTIEPLGA